MAKNTQKIGWIGMGRMGFPMAERLLAAGHDVSIWNRTRAKAEPLAKMGGKIVGRVTSGGYGFAVQQSIAYAYLPPLLATVGQRAEVEIFGDWVGCVVSAEPLFDPDGSRIKS